VSWNRIIVSFIAILIVGIGTLQARELMAMSEDELIMRGLWYEEYRDFKKLIFISKEGISLEMELSNLEEVTDDIRYSPAITIIKKLLKSNAKIKAFDPKAIDNFKKFYPNIKYTSNFFVCLINIKWFFYISK